MQLLNNSVKIDNAHITEMEQKLLCASQEYPEAFLCADVLLPNARITEDFPHCDQ